MADLQSFTITANDGSRRNNSISAHDAGHLAHVDTHVLEEAAKATQAEVSMTLLQGIKTYPKAIGWSVLLSTCIVMEGFDIVLIANLLAVQIGRAHV